MFYTETIPDIVKDAEVNKVECVVCSEDEDTGTARSKVDYSDKNSDFDFCLFDFLLHVHGKQLRLCRDGQVILTTLFRCRLKGQVAMLRVCDKIFVIYKSVLMGGALLDFTDKNSSKLIIWKAQEMPQ